MRPGSPAEEESTMIRRIDAIYMKLSPWLFFFWLVCVAVLLVLLLVPTTNY